MSNHGERFFGIDIGTSSLKAVSVEVKGRAARVVREITEPYGKDDAGLVRSPKVWAERAAVALSKLEGEPRGIGVTGQMHALVALDAHDRVLPPTLLWLDMQGEPQLREFVKRFAGQMVQRTANIPLPDFTLAKWLYASQQNPDLITATRRLLPAKDFVRCRLVPGSPACTDPSEAVGTQLYNPFLRRWDDEIVGAARIPRSAVPEVVEAARQVAFGGGHGQAYFVTGAGDQAAAARAVGADSEGTGSLSLGTSAVVSVPWKLASLPRGWDGALHLLPGTRESVYDVIATVPAFGPGLQWAADLLGGSLSDLDAWAAAGESVPEEERPDFIPYLSGSGAPHPDVHRRAVASGITLGTTREAFARSIYDGFAMELASLVVEIKAWNVPVKEIVISGGATRLENLVLTIASYIDCPCFAVESTAASSVGAALLASDALDPSARPALSRVPVAVSRRCPIRDSWKEQRRLLLSAQR